jgi:glycosyltransferase involved in cell wall biosynthesis
MRLLYIQTSPVPPPVDSGVDRFVLLSGRLEGEVLQPLWYDKSESVESTFGPGSWPLYTRGRFQYRWLLSWRWTGLRRGLNTYWFYISEGLKAHREKPVDCVMTYSHLTPALCGIVIKLLTGAKLVVEIATSPDRTYLYDRPHPTFIDGLRRLYSDLCLHISMWACDCVHLLYAGALDSYPLLRNTRRAVFHEFVPVSAVPRHQCSGDRYILLLGAPWYLKGADLLVEAFRRLAPDFPEVRLKIMGHFTDRSQLDALIDGVERIDMVPAKHYEETLGMISRASMLVLPSRCEGMGRVLLEAMAAGIPVIGSDIGGIPSLIRHGENGFLFPVGDVNALEARLRQLLSDSDLCRKMGKRGYEMAHTEFDERVYVDRFVRMIEKALGRECTSG